VGGVGVVERVGVEEGGTCSEDTKKIIGTEELL